MEISVFGSARQWSQRTSPELDRNRTPGAKRKAPPREIRNGVRRGPTRTRQRIECRTNQRRFHEQINPSYRPYRSFRPIQRAPIDRSHCGHALDVCVKQYPGGVARSFLWT